MPSYPVPHAPFNVSVLNNTLYFIAEDDSTGDELWRYDGINAVAHVTDYQPGSRPSFGGNLCLFKGKIYLDARDTSTTTHLPAYDPATNNITTIPNTKGVGSMTVIGDKMYFQATDSLHGNELWVYDGINAPQLVADIYPGLGSSFPNSLIAYGSAIYFRATDYSSNYEIYKLHYFPSAIQNTRFNGQVNIYPNPSRNNINFSIKSQNLEKLTIVLTDITGKTVYNVEPQQYYKGEQKEITIPVQNLAPAVYFYQVRNETGQLYLSGKVIKE